MAIPNSDDANIFEAEAINWRLIVYPCLAVLIVVVGGFGIYTYLQNQREVHEAESRAAFIQAKTPEALVRVADQYPKTTHAVLALISAADLSFGAKDYASATGDYQRVINGPDTDPSLRDAAEVGLASVLEAENKPDDAIDAYLVAARRGNGSAYAPYAYASAARLYEQKNDKADEEKILTEAASLGSESSFVRDAQARLKTLDAVGSSPSAPSPTPANLPAPAAPQP
jgi:predicted negative regulator of RcsB-dependent stress response